MNTKNYILVMLVALLCISCASYPVNPPLSQIDLKTGYRFENMKMNPGNSDDTFIILALSGGGTRAAAFSYGAIKELDRIKLLDEVDIISSVSGGSFAAAYYGLYGKDRFLLKFPGDVLALKIERALILRILAPWNWWHLASWKYGRSDLADHYYGNKIFNNANFNDLPRKRPFIIINSTDIGLGSRFSFIQEHFDRLCSDLNQVSVSRAVTASSAFPVAFTPLTFKNYPSEECGYETPDWLINAEKDLELNASRYDRALDWESYEDTARSYIHLSDGGLSDNLGLRGPTLGLNWPSSPLSIIHKFNKMHGKRQIKRVAIIVVDAQPKLPIKLDGSAHPPGIFRVLNAAASTPMENYSSDTIGQIRSYITDLKRQFEDANEKAPIEFYFSRVTFEAEKDVKVRHALQKIKTKLQLPENEVKLLVKAGGRLLRQSHDFQRLCKAVGIQE